jgi:hypothetical protein
MTVMWNQVCQQEGGIRAGGLRVNGDGVRAVTWQVTAAV